MTLVVEDPFPGIALADINPMLDRIRSLVARGSLSSSDEPLDRSVQVVESVKIVEGLAYHFERYQALAVSLEGRRMARYSAWIAGADAAGLLQPGTTSDEIADILENVHHESIAYLNRLGQFYYFAEALGRTDLMPRTRELLPFSHKHAHRSIDKPRDDEPLHDRRLQAASIGLSKTMSNGVPVMILNVGDTSLRFTFGIDHPRILNEIYDCYHAELM